MHTTEKKRVRWLLPAAILTPALLLVLFLLLRGRPGAMEVWVTHTLRPAAQWLGRLWAPVPFAVGESVTILALTFAVVYLVRALVLTVRERAVRPLLRRLGALLAAVLWAWAGLCWMWNAAYYADTFTQRSGLETAPYDVAELAAVTDWFAQQAAHWSQQVPRDEGGRFAADEGTVFANAATVYETLEGEFPFLAMEPSGVKPLLLSRLQSVLGFTGVYFPFTGEANVNVDCPAPLRPATIAHELAHQRMVASELEANFVGIAAAVSCDDPVYQYSGYLLGLIQLCNALYPADAQAWQQIVQTRFTRELALDWTENDDYWAALQSPVEEVAEKAYDGFLKSNDQPLGVRSYGACVDLLVAYFGPMAQDL